MHSCDVRRGLLWNYNEFVLANHGARISLKNFIIVNNLQEKSITESRDRLNFLDHFTLPLLGYGHITPETPLGQIVTVLYTFLGVPLTMLTLKTMEKLFPNWFMTSFTQSRQCCLAGNDLETLRRRVFL